MSDTRDIVEFDGDTCVHASAGTGKTTLLVAKFLKLLSGETEGKPTRIDEILAITFSDKAADEMRQRIAREILSRIQETEKAEHGPQRTRTLAHMVNSRRRMAHSYISTIHSFCARVLRENPVEAGIDPMFEIMDAQRSSALMSRSLGQFLLAKLRHGDHTILDLAYRYGFSKEEGFETSLTTIISSLFPLVRAADMGEAALLAEYGEFADGAEGRIAATLKSAVVSAAAVSAAAKTGKAKEIIGKVCGGLPELETASRENREQAVRLATSLRKTLNLQSFQKNEDAKKLAHLIEEMRDGMASLLAFQSARQVAALIVEFRIHYVRNVKNRELIDFDDLQELTLALFKRHTQIRDEYRKLFRGILVDEFQDVNRLQKEIIYSLATPGDKKLFIVGDPKQAIYGFRGGEVRVFAEAQREITEQDGKLFTLTTNYRSTPELVNFANTFFAEKGEVMFGEMDKCIASHPAAGEPAVERITFAPRDSADDSRFWEAQLVATRMREMNRSGIAYRDIVVLFRKFTVLPLYEAAFRNAGVPTMVYRGAGFFQSQEVADMVSVLSFIEDPTDLISWVGALRSPMAGCSDETVLALLRREPGPERLAGPLEREKVAEFTAWTNSIRGMKDRLTISETMEAVLENSGFMGILGAQPNGLQKAGNVLKLIEVGRDMESSGTATLKNFIRRMTALIDAESSEPQAATASPGQDAVRITTIHQAKGLQFPVVFMVDIDGAGARPPSPVLFDQQRGLAMKYVDKATMRSYAGKVHAALSALSAEKEKEDSLRLFYVGCTRAETRLVLSGCQMRKSQKRAEAVDATIEKHPELFCGETREREPVPPAGPSTCAYDILLGEPLDVKLPVPQNGIAGQMRESGGGKVFLTVGDYVSFVRCRREYMLRELFKIRPKTRGGGESADTGSAVHAVLERLDFGVDYEDFKKSLSGELSAHAPGLEPGQSAAAEKSILQLYRTRLMESMRSGKVRAVGREIPFIYKYGGGKRVFFMEGKIDLLLRDENGRPVVADYKYSSAQKPDMSAMLQVELYALAITRGTGSGDAACALAYLKGVPRMYEWEMTAKKLAALEKTVMETSEEIFSFEETNRGAKMPPPMDGLKCPYPACGLARFCL